MNQKNIIINIMKAKNGRQSVVLTVKNENNQRNKSELDSGYLKYECNRIGDFSERI